MPDRSGSIRLFRLLGVEVFLHWSWFVVAVYELSGRSAEYTSPLWNGLEYLTLFGIVLAHEFGHALACRSVGGRADRIVLWPLGGVAYVDPPPRPGATLWSIAAGPLVNAVLLPASALLLFLSHQQGWAGTVPNAHAWLRSVVWVNLALLVFNLLPIYPLDGGQILRSLLWFLIGRARSLLVASGIGLAGVALVVVGALWSGSTWMLVLAVFMLFNCWRGLQHARVLVRLDRLPRRDGFACPTCQASPPTGTHWRCSACQTAFDTFATGAVCPACATRFQSTACFDCSRAHPLEQWLVARPVASPI